ALGRLLEVSDELADAGWRSGPLATLRFMRLAYPHLKVRGGVIINVGSGAQLLSGSDFASFGVYAATKDAIMALTRAAAVEWGPEGIRAVLIMPSAWSPGLESFKQSSPERYAEAVKRKPLGRYGDPEVDIGRPVAWLCSEEAGYVTGMTMMLDGGAGYLR